MKNLQCPIKIIDLQNLLYLSILNTVECHYAENINKAYRKEDLKLVDRIHKSTQTDINSKKFDNGSEKNKKQVKMKSSTSQTESSNTKILKDRDVDKKEMTHKLKKKTGQEQGQVISLEDILDECESDGSVEKENHNSPPISAW